MSHSDTKHPDAPPAPPPSPYSTRPSPISGDAAATHAEALEAMAGRLEKFRAANATSLDADALAMLQAAVVELCGMVGCDVPATAANEPGEHPEAGPRNPSNPPKPSKAA